MHPSEIEEGDSPEKESDVVSTATVTSSTTTSTLAEPVVELKHIVPIISKEESRILKTKVFPGPNTYIQNEEQQESNLWAKTTGKE